jgi:hypothetical protein
VSEPLGSLNPEVPWELERIVNYALEKKPESLYPTVGELLIDLKKYQESLKSAAAGVLDVSLLLRKVRRPKVYIHALIIVFFPVVFGGLVYSASGRETLVRRKLVAKDRAAR